MKIHCLGIAITALITLGCGNSSDSDASAQRVSQSKAAVITEDQLNDLKSKVQKIENSIERLDDKIGDFSDGFSDWKDIVSDIESIRSEDSGEILEVKAILEDIESGLEPGLEDRIMPEHEPPEDRGI